MKITWKTEISELVNVDEVVSIVSDARSKIEEKTNAKIDALELEMTVGGLSKQALMLDNNSPLFDEAKKVVEMYEKQLSNIKELEDKTRTTATKQRKEELTTLKGKIEDKIHSMNSILGKIVSAITASFKEGFSLENRIVRELSASPALGGFINGIKSISDLETAKSTTSSQLTELKEKLQKVEAELGKL